MPCIRADGGAQVAPPDSTAPGNPQRIVRQRLRVRAIDAGLAEKGLPQGIDILAGEILDDEDEPGGAVGIVGPGVEDGGHMHDVLHPVEDDRTRGILGQADQAFHT